MSELLNVYLFSKKEYNSTVYTFQSDHIQFEWQNEKPIYSKKSAYIKTQNNNKKKYNSKKVDEIRENNTAKLLLNKS